MTTINEGQAEENPSSADAGPTITGHPKPADERIIELLSRRRAITANSVQPKALKFAWRHNDRTGFVQANTLTLFAGEAEAGKSTAASWVGANMTRGTLPGIYQDRPTDVLWINFEEDTASAIVPRFMAAQADLSRLHILEGDDTLLDDLGVYIDHYQAGLVVIDPASGLFGARDRNKAGVVRPAFQRLADIASMHNASIIGIAHLKKSTSTQLNNNIAGSSEYVNVVRCVVQFASDGVEDERIMEVTKLNGAAKPPGLKYSIDSVKIPGGESGEVIHSAKFALQGASDRPLFRLINDRQSEKDRTPITLTPDQEKLVNALNARGGQDSYKRIAQRAGMEPKSANKMLHIAAKKGFILDNGSGLFAPLGWVRAMALPASTSRLSDGGDGESGDEAEVDSDPESLQSLPPSSPSPSSQMSAEEVAADRRAVEDDLMSGMSTDEAIERRRQRREKRARS